MNRQKKDKKITTVRNGLAPTKERQFQNGGVRVEAVARGMHGHALVDRYRAVRECALDVYLERKIITRNQHRAGLRFRGAYHSAISCRTAERERWNHYSTTLNDERLHMSEKLITQIHTELDDDDWNVVEDVCGHDFVVWSPKALESLRKGLGHMAINWHSMAINMCEHKKK